MRLAKYFLLFTVAATGWCASFGEAPPTSVVYQPAAYTLQEGRWGIGAGIGFKLIPLAYARSGLTLTYGITPWFQAGFALTHEMTQSTYEFSTKLHLPLGAGLNLGFPFDLFFLATDVGFQFGGIQVSGVASLRTWAGLTVHGGAGLGLGRQGFFFRAPYLGLDLDIAPNLKVAAELGIGAPVYVALGTWLRLFPFLDLKLGMVPLDLVITAEVFLRF